MAALATGVGVGVAMAVLAGDGAVVDAQGADFGVHVEAAAAEEDRVGAPAVAAGLAVKGLPVGERWLAGWPHLQQGGAFMDAVGHASAASHGGELADVCFRGGWIKTSVEVGVEERGGRGEMKLKEDEKRRLRGQVSRGSEWS